MSQPITLHVTLDDVHNIYNALHAEILSCERQHTVCQVRGCAGMMAYYDKRLTALYELGLYLKQKMEAAHDKAHDLPDEIY